MAIDAKDAAVGAAAVGGLFLLSARAGGSDSGGPSRPGRLPIPIPSGGGGGGGLGPQGRAGLARLLEQQQSIQERLAQLEGGATGGGSGPTGGGGGGGGLRTAIDAARGTGQATDAVLDAGSGGVDFFADAIGGDAPGAFSTTGGITGASYRSGQLTGNAIDAAADAIGGDAPGAFSTTGGLTGKSYNAGRATRQALSNLNPLS